MHGEICITPHINPRPISALGLIWGAIQIMPYIILFIIEVIITLSCILYVNKQINEKQFSKIY